MSKVTVKEVAQRAGVSVATVSRILNGMGGYGAQTEQRVMTAISELGYRQNTVARNLKMQCGNAIAFVVSRMNTDFYLPVLEAVQDEAAASGFSTTIVYTRTDPQSVKEHLKSFRQSQLAGALFCGHQPSAEFDAAVEASGLPCVLMNNKPTDREIPFVKVSDFDGAYAQVKYLYEKGHRRIALLCGMQEDKTAGMRRYNGYRAAFRDYGLSLDESLVFFGNFSFADTRPQAKKMLARIGDFTAVIAACDDMAMAVASEAYRAGLKIPKDFSIIGYDNLPCALMMNPPLTTIAQPLEEIGRKSVNLLLERIRMGDCPAENYLDFKIIERDSVMAI